MELRPQDIHYRPLTWTADERFSTQQTLTRVGTGSRCLRNRFSAGGNMRSKSLLYGAEQPRNEQFCQIHRHRQNGFSLVSLIEPCTTGNMSPLLTVDPATTTMPTPRLTQRYQTTTSPLSPAIRLSVCSHQVPKTIGRHSSSARLRGPAPS